MSIARDVRDAGDVDAALALYDEAPGLNGDRELTAAAARESAALRAAAGGGAGRRPESR